MAIYVKLFVVDITHGFHTVASDINKSLELFPLPETANVMKGGKMLFRKTGTGLTIFFSAFDSDPNTSGVQVEPIVTLDTPLSFTFLLRLANKTEFLNITELDQTGPSETYEASKLAFFSNSAMTGALDYELLEGLRAPIFTYHFPFLAPTPSTDTGTITIKDEGGTPLPGFPVTNIKPDTNGNYYFPVDLHKFPKGRYIFETLDTSTSAVTEEFYIDGDLATQDVFGLIRITYPDNAVIYGTSVNDYETFSIDFTARQSKWRYYVLDKSGTHPTLGSLSIDASTASPPLSFPATTTTTINGIPTAVFESPAANIPFRQAPRENIKLKYSAATIVDDMPTPVSDQTNGAKSPPDKTISEIFVFV